MPETTISTSGDIAARPDGTVTGVPRRWLRMEGAVLASGALIAYSSTGQPWWLSAGNPLPTTAATRHPLVRFSASRMAA